MSHRTPTIPKLMLALAAITHAAHAQLYNNDDADDLYYSRAWDDVDGQTPMVAKRCYYYTCHYDGRWHLTGPAIAGVTLFSFLILIFMIVIVRHCFIEAHDADLYYQSQNHQEAYLPQNRPAPRYSYPLNGPASAYSPPPSSSPAARQQQRQQQQEMREHTRERRRYAAMPVVPLTIPNRQQPNPAAASSRAAPPPWEPREPLPAYMTDANNPKVAPGDDEKASPDAASDYSHR